MAVITNKLPVIIHPIPIKVIFVIICLDSEKICNVQTMKDNPIENKIIPGIP